MLAYAREPDRLARFDAALWTFSALDFLPHVYADSPLVAHTPIVLTLSARAAPRCDVLLTLDDDAPEDFGTWFAAGSFRVNFGLMADHLNGTMLLVITGVITTVLTLILLRFVKGAFIGYLWAKNEQDRGA